MLVACFRERRRENRAQRNGDEKSGTYRHAARFRNWLRMVMPITIRVIQKLPMNRDSVDRRHHRRRSHRGHYEC